MTDMNPTQPESLGHTINDLHVLLNDLTGGEHVKATWKTGQVEVAASGPVHVEDGGYCECHQPIRWSIDGINSTLTSFEVARTEEVTITRDDEDALHALLDSLTDGQEATAEWRSDAGSMVLTGTAMSDGTYVWVRGPFEPALRTYSGDLHSTLHSVTVRRPVVRRWERG